MQSNISERKRQAGTGWGPGMSFQSPSSHTTCQAPPATSQQVLSSQEPSRHTAPGAFAGVGGVTGTCSWGRFQNPRGSALLAEASLSTDI